MLTCRDTPMMHPTIQHYHPAPKISHATEDSVEMAKDALSSLVRESHGSFGSCKRISGTELEARLRSECGNRNLFSAVHLDISIETGVDLALTAYAHVHPDVQYYIALFTILFALVDNHSVSQSALESYASRGDTSGDPILEWFAEVVSRAHEHFVPFAAGTICAATMGYINAEILDAEIGASPRTHWPLGFVDYKRVKSGLSEAYTMFVFEKRTFPGVLSYVHIVPDAVLFLNLVNDIASFYKEELAHETGTYVHERVVASGKSVQEVLHEIVGEIIAAARDVEKSLQGHLEKEAWSSFAKGYLHFHLVCARYRLNELGLF